MQPSSVSAQQEERQQKGKAKKMHFVKKERGHEDREIMDLSGHGRKVPIPASITYVGGPAKPHGQSIIHDSTTPLRPSNSPLAPPAIAEDHLHSSTALHSTKKGVVEKYMECLKNHAASIGGNATDGCGEFMPSGKDGTLEALKCSACNCHRNFHRKETEGESSCDCYHPLKGRKILGHKGLVISGSDAFGNGHASSFIPRPSPHNMIMPLRTLQTSESDEMEGIAGVMARPPMVKKRFRTKFTPEQKEKMLNFAEKVGWRLHKHEESVVQQFCYEIGIKKSVLKVWMHNNRHKELSPA